MKRTRTTGAMLAAMLWAMGGAAAACAAEAPKAADAAEPADSADRIGAMLAEYGKIHEALAADSAEGVTSAAAAIATLAKGAPAKPETREPLRVLAAAAGAMTGTDLAALRSRLNDLSKAMARAVEAGGGGAEIFYCPMADGYWLQKKGDDVLRNPYYGKSMPTCGVKVQSVED